MTEAAERIQEIIDAAEHVAEEIRADAERDAQRYLEGKRREADSLTAGRAQALSRLTADITEHAKVVRERTEAMLRALEDTTAELTSASPAPAKVARMQPSTVRPATPEPAGEAELEVVEEPDRGEDTQAGITAAEDREDSEEASVPVEPQSPAEIEESAMLRATQMAVAGSTRENIAGALESEFGISDPESILNDILGPG